MRGPASFVAAAVAAFTALSFGITTGVNAATTPVARQIKFPEFPIEIPPVLVKQRTINMLATIPGLPVLPYPRDVISNATLNASNIQCDILTGMLKKLELFYFFQITDKAQFKSVLHNYVAPLVTPAIDMLNTSTQPQVALNIAFSQTGLRTLGISDNLNDGLFTAAQAPDAVALGDPGTTKWKSVYTAPDKLHGVMLLASDDMTLIDSQLSFLQSLFGGSMVGLYKLLGNIRPAPFDGHEMFGYLDGISQPAVAGFHTSVLPGQLLISPGIILVGQSGDTLTRPSWSKDGSFMAFRELQQLVPEFNKWLLDNAPPFPGFTAQQSADLFGARLNGRWKSGCPVDLSPLVDNPTIGANASQNNNFDFTHTGFNFVTDQSHCPFHSHIRKTRPRADLAAPFNTIMRGGIPYGPEVTASETKGNKTELERGLAFVAYQSQLRQGYHFIQQSWANDPNFVFGKNVAPGFDPIIGQKNGAPRWITGANINNPTGNMTLSQEFVVSRGGEYFFSPSIAALFNTISV